MTWEELKQKGNELYKTGKIEPIDLYRSSGMLRHFALSCIIKYSFRNAGNDKPLSIKDMKKVIHYAEMLIVDEEEKGTKVEVIWPNFRSKFTGGDDNEK